MDVSIVTDYLKQAKHKKDFGWLGFAEARSAGLTVPNLKSHLSEVEKQLVFRLHILIRPSPTKIGELAEPHTCLLAHAWGVCERTIRYIGEKAVESLGETNLKQKGHSDKGLNIFTSAKKAAGHIHRYECLQKETVAASVR